MVVGDSAMTVRARSIVAILGLGLIAIGATGCGTGSSYLNPSTSTTTLMAGWEHRFTLEWSADPESGGGRRIRGYVTSQHGEYADHLRLLAQALDASGAVVGQKIVYVPAGIAGFQRAYFEIPGLPSADHYRVSVWDYSLLQSVRASAP